jgi:hypothetical protein
MATTDSIPYPRNDLESQDSLIAEWLEEQLLNGSTWGEIELEFKSSLNEHDFTSEDRLYAAARRFVDDYLDGAPDAGIRAKIAAHLADDLGLND